MRANRAVAAALAALAACGGGAAATPGGPDAAPPSPCNPLGGVACVLPIPSSIYEAGDATTATGVRVDFAPGSLPANGGGVHVDVAPFNRRDGFSADAPTMGLTVLAPAVDVPWGLTAAAGPLASALAIYDEHKAPTPPLTNSSLPDNGAHGSLRARQAVQEQMRTFLDTGAIVQTCTDRDAPVACDCPTDAVCGPHI